MRPHPLAVNAASRASTRSETVHHEYVKERNAANSISSEEEKKSLFDRVMTRKRRRQSKCERLGSNQRDAGGC